MKLFFVVGESSGDVIAAALIRRLKEEYGEDIECLGVGGPRMKSAGFEQLLPMDQISIMGIWEVLPKIPRLLKINKAIVEEIEKQQPDAVITVDFPDFNFRVAKALKKRGTYQGKLIHYVAPSVWAWRPGRAKTVSQFLDAIICLFPMEPQHFAQHGLPSKFVGHPVVETKALEGDGEMFRRENDIEPKSRTLGVFFGSRENEFKTIGSILCQAARMIDDVEDDLKIIVPTLPEKEYEVQTILKGFTLPVYVSANPNVKWDAFKACDVAVAVSGTVALELAYCGIPHIIVYKASSITAGIVRLMARVKHVHLANILLEDFVVPELLQGKCNSEKIASAALTLANDKQAQALQREKFEELRAMLGANDPIMPSEKAAHFIIEVCQGKHPKTEPIPIIKEPKKKKSAKTDNADIPTEETQGQQDDTTQTSENSTVVAMTDKAEDLKHKAEDMAEDMKERAEEAAEKAKAFLKRFKK